MFALAPTGPWFLLGVPFISLWGLGGAAEQSIMSAHVSADAQGRLSGATASLIAMAGMIGPLFFTRIFAHVLRHPELELPGAPYLVATVLLAIAIAVAWRATRSIARSPTPTENQSTG